jgi:glutamate--cysteine ligase
MRPLAQQLDAAHGGALYAQALDASVQGLDQPDTLPSARVLEVMQKDFNGSFVAFVRAQSERLKRDTLAAPVSADKSERFKVLAEASWADQNKIEAADTMPFDVYLKTYLDPKRLIAKTL